MYFLFTYFIVMEHHSPLSMQINLLYNLNHLPSLLLLLSPISSLTGTGTTLSRSLGRNVAFLSMDNAFIQRRRLVTTSIKRMKLGVRRMKLGVRRMKLGVRRMKIGVRRMKLGVRMKLAVRRMKIGIERMSTIRIRECK